MTKRAYYSVAEVAVLLGVSRAAIRRAIRAGRLPAVRLARLWRIPVSTFEVRPRRELEDAEAVR